MNTTKRRKQFLENVIRIYFDTLKPVHYETVANVMGVSRWTAYDVLKVLEGEGYLERKYEKNDRGTGRSIILFAPTRKVLNMYNFNKEIVNSKELESIEARIIKLLANDKKRNYTETIDKLLLPLQKFEYCFCYLNILVYILKQVCGGPRPIINFSTSTSNKPDVQLSVFVGLAIGVVSREMEKDIGQTLCNKSQQFFDYLDELNYESWVRLLDHLKQKYRQQR